MLNILLRSDGEHSKRDIRTTFTSSSSESSLSEMVYLGTWPDESRRSRCSRGRRTPCNKLIVVVDEEGKVGLLSETNQDSVADKSKIVISLRHHLYTSEESPNSLRVAHYLICTKLALAKYTVYECDRHLANRISKCFRSDHHFHLEHIASRLGEGNNVSEHRNSVQPERS